MVGEEKSYPIMRSVIIATTRQQRSTYNPGNPKRGSANAWRTESDAKKNLSENEHDEPLKVMGESRTEKQRGGKNIFP
jgi:hypothetical protein